MFKGGHFEEPIVLMVGIIMQLINKYFSRHLPTTQTWCLCVQSG